MAMVFAKLVPPNVIVNQATKDRPALKVLDARYSRTKPALAGEYVSMVGASVHLGENNRRIVEHPRSVLVMIVETCALALAFA